jgi:hypothetical protein
MKRKDELGSASNHRSIMRWGVLMGVAVGALSVALGFGVGAKKASASLPSTVSQSGTCGDRYNAMLRQAKAALAKGDRNGAIRGLIAARSQLRDCEAHEQLESAPSSALGLNDVSFELKTVCS